MPFKYGMGCLEDMMNIELLKNDWSLLINNHAN